MVFEPLCRTMDAFHGLGAFENACHGVVLRGAYGITHVIMATGAPDGKSKKSLANDVELLIDHIHFHFDGIGFRQKFGT